MSQPYETPHSLHLTDTIRLLFASDKAFCRKLYDILGFAPRHTAYYREALEHSSMHAIEGDYKGKDNERMEYLGDAILGAIVADLLYKRFPTKHEGFLTNARSKMVRRDTLNKMSHRIGLDALIHSSMGGHTHNCCVAGNALEAFIGAIYLDRGYHACRRFIEHRLFGTNFDVNAFVNEDTNYKSRIIEWCQKRQYDVQFVIDHQGTEQGSPYFLGSVCICGVKAGNGKGYSKKECHQEASREALDHIRRRGTIYQSIRAVAQPDEEDTCPQPGSSSEA